MPATADAVDLWTLSSTKAEIIGAAADDQRKVTNRGPGSFYYKTAADVDSGDTEVSSGSSVTFDAANFVISASVSNLTVERFSGDVSVSDDLSVADDLSVTDASTLTGGITQATAPHGFYNWQPTVATSGTDTAPAADTHFLTSIFLPVNKTLTGVGYLIGTVGGTDKVYAALYDADGALLANSSVTGGGATVGTAAQVQTLAFSSTYAAKGPRLYYVGISMNGNTARLRTVPAHTQVGLFAGSVTQVHGTVAAVTEPVTFTADKAPICFVY